MRARFHALAMLAALLAAPATDAAQPDISGRWLPVPELSTPWPDPLPLTPGARQRLAAFEADRDEPAGFCMPLGTPRNTLSGTSALEVLQTDDRVYFLFQPNLLNVETRRVWTNGRALPPAELRFASWLGTSRGTWEGDVLNVETVDLEPQAILDGNGLRHEGGLVVRERWQVKRDRDRGRVLVNDMQLEDKATFSQPVRLQRVFVWAPQATFAEGQCSERLWIDGLWRQRLAEHADAARKKTEAGPGAAQ